MKQRVLFLLRSYLLTVVFFLGAKVVFLFANRGEHPFEAGDVADVLRHGMSLDLSTALYFMIIPFLLVVVSIWWTGRWLQWLMRGWFCLVAVAFSLAFVADTALYPHWGFKLDATCLQYLSTPEAAAASVSWGWLIIGTIATIGIVGIMGWAYWRICRPFSPLRKRWPLGLTCLVLAPLVFLGIRGGVNESTTNIGQVYYSQTPFLNHAAVNPVFSFLASFEKSVRANVRYTFYEEAECDSLLQGLFPTTSEGLDTLLTTRRPNVVLIMLEGAGGMFTKISGRDHVMPYFSRLSDEGIYFSQCYANSFRTDRGTLCTWSGYPSFPTMSVMKSPQKSGSLPSLARSLQHEGYATHYFYGGDINFTNMRSYLVGTGFQRLSSMSDYSLQEQRTARWGVRDDLMFRYVREEIEGWAKDAKKPHLIGFSTLSSHEPWDVPVSLMDDPVENAFRYLDQCLEEFIETLRKSPAWDSLLLVLVPDHGIGHYGLDETNPLRNHIPVVWVGGAVREPREVSVICNQTDQVATLLGQMGLPHDDFRFSRDVLSQNYIVPFAYHTFNNGFSIIDSTRFVVYDLNVNQPLVGEDEALIRRGKAILQVTSEDLAEK